MGRARADRRAARDRETARRLIRPRYSRPRGPLKFLLASFVGWVNRHQAQAIEYLVEENRVLKEQLGKKRLTDDQRRRLAVKGKALGRRMLDRVATIVTPCASATS